MNKYEYDKNGSLAAIALADGTAGSSVQSQALQEIIDVLKYPFQTSCDNCNGLGFVRSGQDCPACDGKGKVLDDFFK